MAKPPLDGDNNVVTISSPRFQMLGHKHKSASYVVSTTRF